MNKTTNILIVGVGGQGTILASRVLSRVAQSLGQDVKVSEIHGMAQRGGSVVTQVRFGEEVASPIIQKGQADIILAFEKLEALRWVSHLKAEGTIIINDQRIDPMPVIARKAVYPEDIPGKIKACVENMILVDGIEKAQESGNIKAVNVVLLGVLSKILDIDSEVWLGVLKNTVPAKFLEANLKAFEAGRNN